MSVKEAYTKTKHFLTKGIWELNVNEFNKVKARLIRYLKVVIITLRTFSAQKIGFQATALSFFSTLAVVPFIALAFIIFNGFGLTDRLLDLLHEYFAEQEYVDMLIGFANNIVDSSQNSVFGLISALLFAWSVVWMMFSVGRVFNNVWKVEKSRNIFKRFGFYLLIIIVAPFVVMLFFSGSIVYTNALSSIGLSVEYFSTLSSILAWLIFYVVATLVFSVMYKFIPNHKVKYINALKASVVSGFAFTVMQILYLGTQVFVTRLGMVYGAMALIPILMLWMNFGWFIILYGAELSYAFQNVHTYNLEEN